MIKNINALKRFDFTPNCRTCEFRKDLGELEYCCSFVFEQMQQERLLELKKHIIEYVLFDDDLIKIEPSNVCFNEEDEWSVTLNFRTNLREDKTLIVNEIIKAISKSPYFRKISFVEDSLIKADHNGNPQIIESVLDDYIKKYGGVV